MAAKPNEIQITRVYDAPVKLVWEAWTDLKHVEKWWGPRGFSITTKSKDLRPGGKWIYTMHGPDGTDYSNITTYHEVVPYQKLVYDHGANEKRDKLFTVTVTFKEEKGKTVMAMTMAVATADEAKAMKAFIKQANGNSTWDRLAEFLEDQTSGKDAFILNRSFEAKLETVFKMWIDPEHIARWMGPTGSTMGFVTCDIREGGSSLYRMKNADGQKMYGQFHYKTIRPHDLFIYAQNFSDSAGRLVKAPFAPDFPDRLQTTVQFALEGSNTTRVTLRWEILGDATDAERRLFKEMKAGMMQRWGGSFDKLEQALEEKR